MFEKRGKARWPRSFARSPGVPLKPCPRGAADPAVERAWHLLFQEETLWRVVQWLSKLGVPQGDLPDVTQTVLLEAVKGFPTYDPRRARPERWLNRIAIHVASHYFGKAYHRREVLVEPTGMEIGDDGEPSAFDQLLSEERRVFLLEVITHLQADQARILTGYYLFECTMLELAEMREIPVSTAYKRRARALAAARSIARELQDEERLDGETAIQKSRGTSALWPGERPCLQAIYRRSSAPPCLPRDGRQGGAWE